VTARLAIFRADASSDIGTGHVFRCRTLAQALAPLGWTTILAAREVPDSLRDRWPGGGAVIRLTRLAPPSAELKLIAERVGGRATLIVGDGYGLDAAWFDAARRNLPGAILMAIDDLADRALPVDIMLNQNLGVERETYAERVPPGARVLIGPRYALVRSEFAILRERPRVRDGHVGRLLVFMSGADKSDVTRHATEALAALNVPCDVVVGASYGHLTELRELIQRMPHATLHVNTDVIADLMDRADLAIGAPSSASWERCTLGLPTVMVTLAANQVAVGRELDRLGAGISLGWHADVTESDIEAAVRALVSDPVRVAAMSRRAARVTDGRGTSRVLAEIEAVVTGTMHG
jgi:UDP-2,4-diacetamido-2,4,6-trideoxy-beta-L-altropyranose hydrolase